MESDFLRRFGPGFLISRRTTAAIIAKHERDRLFEEIARRYRAEFGEVRGGGYVNAATADFIRRYHTRYGKLPPETRKSWGWKLLRELDPAPLPLFDGADGM
jgi:ribonuclease HII